MVLGDLCADNDCTGRRHEGCAERTSILAVMAATGLLYLAILAAFGTDLVARAILDAAVSSSAV